MLPKISISVSDLLYGVSTDTGPNMQTTAAARQPFCSRNLCGARARASTSRRTHLGDGGVAGEAVRGVTQGNRGGPSRDGDHPAPLGKAGTGLVVLSGALGEAVEALAPGLVVAVDQGHQTLVNLDACREGKPPSRMSVASCTGCTCMSAS